MNESAGSKVSGSEDEPLVPDDFDDDFYKSLKEKVPLITKALRQKDTQESADNVQRLVIVCNRYKSQLQVQRSQNEELSSEVVRLKERLEQAENLTRLDQDTIAKLRTVIENAWKQKDAAQLREQVAQEELLRLREKVETLENIVGRLSDKSQMLQSRRDEQKERDKYKAEVKELNKRLQLQRVYTTDIEAMVKTLDEKNRELLKLLDETHSEAYNNRKRTDVLQKELNYLKAEEIKFSEQIAQLKTQTEHLTKVKVRQNLQILALKSNLAHLNTQYNVNCNKLAKLTVELEYAIQERDRHKRDLVQRSNLLKLREDEIIKLRQENAKLCKSQENTVRKCSQLDELKQELELEINVLKTQFGTQDKEIEAMRRLIQHFEKDKENLTQERDVLKRDLLLKQKAAENSDVLFHESQQDVKILNQTIHQMQVKHKKHQEELKNAQKDQSKKVNEIQSLFDKIDTLQVEIDFKNNTEKELKQTINDLEVHFSKLKTQHDVLLNEKNALSRQLQTMDDDKTKLEQQLSGLQETINMLKDKISYRDGEISKLQLQVDRLEKERRMLKTNVRNSQLGQQHVKAELLEKKRENDIYTKSLNEDEIKLSRLKKAYDKVLNEKNSINVTLTKRTEENIRLKDDRDTLQIAYDQTCKHLTQREQDIRIVRTEIKNLRTERNVLLADRESTLDLRQENSQLLRIVNQERIKSKALLDEMLTPMNIHRWRNLGGTDPERLSLLQSNQALKKQILQLNVEALEQNRILEETQQLYRALKEFMLKLPSHTIRGDLNKVKASLKGKEKKVRALTAELRIKDVDERANYQKLEELKSNFAAIQYQLTQEKKTKQKLLDEHQMLVQMQAQCFSAPPNMQRVLGAGFKIMSNF